MGNLAVFAIVVLAAGLAVRSMIHRKKRGMSLRCGGSCRSCAGHCSALMDEPDGEKK